MQHQKLDEEKNRQQLSIHRDQHFHNRRQLYRYNYTTRPHKNHLKISLR